MGSGLPHRQGLRASARSPVRPAVIDACPGLGGGRGRDLRAAIDACPGLGEDWAATGFRDLWRAIDACPGLGGGRGRDLWAAIDACPGSGGGWGQGPLGGNRCLSRIGQDWGGSTGQGRSPARTRGPLSVARGLAPLSIEFGAAFEGIVSDRSWSGLAGTPGRTSNPFRIPQDARVRRRRIPTGDLEPWP